MLPVPPAPGGPRRLPCWFGYYDHVLRRDRATGRWTFEALVTSGREDALERRLEELSRRAHAARDTQARGYSCGTFRLIPPPQEHVSAVRQTVSYIGRGDLFQANICLRLEADFDGDPLDAFCGAATRLDPPYAAFLRLPEGAVASLSPELFLRRTGTSVLSRPIKGTALRSEDEAAARRQREALERSAKDQAENVMIVDLMRNDLSRVCTPGSVTVPALLHAQAHPGVWHLVSDVHGTLPPGTGDTELIRATFPPGSVTGAPKVRALEVICELEATPREVYTGAIGYRSPVAGLELNVAIRTFEFHGDRVWLGSGGGITAASDPDAEYRECLLKAAPLIRALGATLTEEPASPSPRPRPALGVFTSLRVTGGRCRDLDRHLARLDDSTWRLFGKHLPPATRTELAARLAGRPSGRLGGGPPVRRPDQGHRRGRARRPRCHRGGPLPCHRRGRARRAQVAGPPDPRPCPRAGQPERGPASPDPGRGRGGAGDRPGQHLRGDRRRPADPARGRTAAPRHHPGGRAAARRTRRHAREGRAVRHPAAAAGHRGVGHQLRPWHHARPGPGRHQPGSNRPGQRGRLLAGRTAVASPAIRAGPPARQHQFPRCRPDILKHTAANATARRPARGCPHRQLRLLHPQPGAPSSAHRLPRRGHPQRRSISARHRGIRPRRRCHLARPRHPRRRRDQHRRRPRLRPHHAAAGHLPRPPGHRRRRRRHHRGSAQPAHGQASPISHDGRGLLAGRPSPSPPPATTR